MPPTPNNIKNGLANAFLGNEEKNGTTPNEHRAAKENNLLTSMAKYLNE